MSGGTRKRHRAEEDEEMQMPENRHLELVIDILQRRDDNSIFAEPVDPNEVEGYYDIVKEPMDFHTMRDKLKEGMYHSLKQFKDDVSLITGNAMKFNASTTIYYKEARGIQDLAKRIFNALANDPESLETKFNGTRRRSTRIQLVNKSPTPSLKPPQIPTKCRKTEFKTTKDEELFEKDRRCTYTPSLMRVNEGRGQQLILNGELQEGSYKKSLMLFVRDLGPTAKMVAARKLRSPSNVVHQVLDVKKTVVNEKPAAAAAAVPDTSPRVIPVVLALEHSQPNITNPNEYFKWKARNKKVTDNNNNNNLKTDDAETERTPLQKLQALMEEEGKKPSTGTSAFTFDLGFLKTQLQKMNTPVKPAASFSRAP